MVLFAMVVSVPGPENEIPQKTNRVDFAIFCYSSQCVTHKRSRGQWNLDLNQCHYLRKNAGSYRESSQYFHLSFYVYNSKHMRLCQNYLLAQLSESPGHRFRRGTHRFVGFAAAVTFRDILCVFLCAAATDTVSFRTVMEM